MKPDLLAQLRCPKTQGELVYDEASQELISDSAQLAYKVEDGIPVMLEEEARELCNTPK